jgi:hypothetical protein
VPSLAAIARSSALTPARIARHGPPVAWLAAADGGIGSGRRVVSAARVARPVIPHARVREDADDGHLFSRQTFHLARRDYPCFAMSGSGGNKVYAFPRGH